MSTTIEKREFLNLGLGESQPTSYLSDNIGDVTQVKTFIRFENYITATTTDTDDSDGLVAIVGHPDASTTGGIIPDPRYLWTSELLGFEGVNEGDEITVYRPTDQTYHVTIVEEIVSTQLLLMTTPYGLTSETPFPVGSVAYVSTDIQSIEFYNGLIENSEPTNYTDKTTGVGRRARVEGLSNTVTSETQMTQLGDKAYQYGTLSVRGNGSGDGPTVPAVSQAFVITQTFVNGPLSTADQVSNIKSRIAPPYLIDNNCLKYVSRTELSKDLNNPNDVKSGITDATLKGNSGFTNENLNTGIQRYTISGVTYTRPDLTTTDSIELSTNEMTIEFFVNNTENAPFSNGNTKFVFRHWVLHENPDEYRLPQFPDPSTTYPARDRFLKENQLFDRIECTLGTLSATPDNLGGTDQIIKECDSLFISSSQIKVTATIEMSAQAVARISSIPGLNYEISIEIADHTKTRSKSDKESPVVDIQPYFIETADPTMITPVNGFILHTGSDVDTDQVESAVIRPGDDFNPTTIFSLNRNDVANYERANAAIDFISITTQIIAKKGSEFFVLDEQKQNLNNLPIIIDPTYGTVPEIDVQKDRGFASPVDDLRKYFVIKRRSDLDAAGLFYYEVNYPCIFRWEPWEKLAGVPEEFYDRDAPANQHFGKNHDWAHYVVGTSWDIYYRIQIVATKDGIPQTYSLDSLLLVEDYLQGVEWDTENIKAFKTDAAGTPGDEIIQGIQSGTMENELTLIRGEKTYLDPPHTAPTLPDLEMVFLVSVFEETNYKGAFLISSLYDRTGNSPWIGLNGILKTTKTNNALIYRAEAILQNGFFSAGQQLRIACRFYDKREEGPPVPPAVGILEEDGTFIIEEGVSTIYGIEE